MITPSLALTEIAVSWPTIVVRPANWGVTLVDSLNSKNPRQWFPAEIHYFECGTVIGLVHVPALDDGQAAVFPLDMLRLGPLPLHSAMVWMDEYPF